MTDKNETPNDPISRIARNIEIDTDPDNQVRKADKISLYWEKTGSFTDIFIKPFIRAGSLVRAHYRRKRNATDLDNYTTKGNINPYTERKGTRPAKRWPLVYDPTDDNHPNLSISQSVSSAEPPPTTLDADTAEDIRASEREVNHHAIEIDINTMHDHATNSTSTHHLPRNQSD
jgi:hypothetical protein